MREGISYLIQEKTLFFLDFRERQSYEDDLNVLWEALVNMFEHDHSAARGMMATQKLFIFKHDSALGNAPSAKLFELVNISKKDAVQVPRKFADYNVVVNRENLPGGVALIEK